MSEMTTIGLRKRAISAYERDVADREAAEAARRQEEHDRQVDAFRHLLGDLVEDPMCVGVITSSGGRLYTQIDGIHIGFRPWDDTQHYRNDGIFAYVPCGECGLPAKIRELRSGAGLEDLGAWLTREEPSDTPLCRQCYAAKVGQVITPAELAEPQTLADRLEDLIREIVREEMVRG